MSLDERFTAAVDIVQKLPKNGAVTVSTDDKLNFYSLYKQATIGKVNVSQPSLFYITEWYKWNSWNALGDMSSEEAKEKYVTTLLDMLAKVSKQMDILDWLKTGDADPDLPAKFKMVGFNGGENTALSSDDHRSSEHA